VICRKASVLAFHLWPTIFAGAPFQLQNICRHSVPPRSHTTTPLVFLCSIHVALNSGITSIGTQWRPRIHWKKLSVTGGDWQSTTRSKLTSKPRPAKQVYSNAEFVRLAKHTQNSVWKTKRRLHHGSMSCHVRSILQTWISLLDEAAVRRSPGD